jgi:hypothetical protein
MPRGLWEGCDRLGGHACTARAGRLVVVGVARAMHKHTEEALMTFNEVRIFETGPINSSIFYFKWAVDGGANAVFGPMAMILSATRTHFLINFQRCKVTQY